MKKLQEELNKQMQQMKDGKTPNPQGSKPNSMMFSKMAMQQEMIRRELQRLQDQMDKDGKKPGGMGKTQEMMNETEKDLLNKRITPETVKRQQEIMTRMLDHEKAIKEQENDNNVNQMKARKCHARFRLHWKNISSRKTVNRSCCVHFLLI